MYPVDIMSGESEYQKEEFPPAFDSKGSVTSRKCQSLYI